MEKSTPVVEAAGGKINKLSNRLGRGIPNILSAYQKICSCTRGKTIVFCRSCGYYCNGRIRLMCPQHPRVSFLLDLTECPRCHSSVYLDEYAKSS